MMMLMMMLLLVVLLLILVVLGRLLPWGPRAAAPLHDAAARGAAPWPVGTRRSCTISHATAAAPSTPRTIMRARLACVLAAASAGVAAATAAATTCGAWLVMARMRSWSRGVITCTVEPRADQKLLISSTSADGVAVDGVTIVTRPLNKFGSAAVGPRRWLPATG